jgi:hypothetical protein
MASAQSGITLNHSWVAGNATLFEGSTVESSGYSRIELKSGTRMDLGAGSQAKIFSTHATLDRGQSEIQSGTGFELNANSLRIRPVGDNTVLRVKIDGGAVTVEARNAPVEVSNSAGLLVARVNPGLPLSFMQGAGASFESTGCVLQRGGAAIVVEPASKTTTELRGADLRKVIGNQATVKGTIDSSATPAGGASQVVKVSTAKITAKGGCDAAATAAGASVVATGLGVAAGAGAAAAAGGAAGVVTGAGVSTGIIIAGAAIGVGAAVGIGVAVSGSH